MTRELGQGLIQIATRWLDPEYALRRQALGAAAAEFCLSPASFELALDWIFSQWTESKIAALLAQNPFTEKRYVVQVLACTTPAMIAQGFLQGAILNLPQCLKIPRKQPSFARLLYQSFAEVFKDAPLFELTTGEDDLKHFYSKLAQADLVFAYGQDETLVMLKKHLARDALFISHGHAESAALIFKEAARLSTLEKLAYDFLSYDQRGCLSPRLTLVEEGGELSAADCARVFAETALPALARRLPRGGLFEGEAAEILHQRNLYAFRGTVYCGEDWTVCYDEKPQWPTMALPRFMPFKPFANHQALTEMLQPIQNQLISLGYAGPPARVKELAETLTTRFCPVGEMQKQLLIF